MTRRADSRLSLPGNPVDVFDKLSGRMANRPELTAISHRITNRDITIATWLDQHGVFTTSQIAQAFFGSPITCTHRLAVLRRLGFLDRFRRRTPTGGHSTACWVLGPLGARWCAAAADRAPPTAAQLRRLRDRHAASAQLHHRLGVHQLMVDLYTAGVLHRWWSATETASRLASRIRPDAAGQVDQVPFFLEHDTGTMPIDRLTRKLDLYQALRAEGGPAWPVLFHLPSRTRQDHLHAALASRRSPVPVATAIHGQRPHEPVWRLAGPHPQPPPLRIDQLPHRPATGTLWAGELT